MKKDKHSFDIFAGVSFDDFWAVYDFKVDKAAAEKAWSRIPASFHAQIMAAAKQYAEFCKEFPDELRPYPASWLNGKRYQDDLSALRYRYARNKVAGRESPVVPDVRPTPTGTPAFVEPTQEEREEGKRILKEYTDKAKASMDLNKRARIDNILNRKAGR